MCAPATKPDKGFSAYSSMCIVRLSMLFVSNKICGTDGRRCMCVYVCKFCVCKSVTQTATTNRRTFLPSCHMYYAFHERNRTAFCNRIRWCCIEIRSIAAESIQSTTRCKTYGIMGSIIFVIRSSNPLLTPIEPTVGISDKHTLHTLCNFVPSLPSQGCLLSSETLHEQLRQPFDWIRLLST